MGERIDHIATGRNLSPEEELLPHHGGRKQRRWRWIRGHFPVPAGCRHRNSGPPKLDGDGGGDRNCFWRKGFWNQGFRDGRNIYAKGGNQRRRGGPRRPPGAARGGAAPGGRLGLPWLPSGPSLVLREASCTLIFPVFFPEFLGHF